MSKLKINSFYLIEVENKLLVFKVRLELNSDNLVLFTSKNKLSSPNMFYMSSTFCNLLV